MHEHMLPALESISRSDAELYQQHSTNITVLLNDFLLRYLNTLYKEFNGDITLAIILGEIAHHTVALHIMQSSSGNDLPKETVRDDVDSRVNVLACNPFSISEATGIPRETVRRKFMELERMGYVDKISSRSYIINLRVADRFVPDFNVRLFEGFRALCAQMQIALKKQPDVKTAT